MYLVSVKSKMFALQIYREANVKINQADIERCLHWRIVTSGFIPFYETKSCSL